MGLKVPLIIQVVARCALPRACRCNLTIVDLGALYTMAKGHDHDIEGLETRAKTVIRKIELEICVVTDVQLYCKTCVTVFITEC